MGAARPHRRRPAASVRIAAPLLVVLLSVAGFVVTTNAVDADRHAAEQRRAATDAQQLRALLDQAGSFSLGLTNTLTAQPRPSPGRFAALEANAATVGPFPLALWVEPVTARARRAYERRTGRPITRLRGTGAAGRAASYLPATYVAGLRVRRGADVTGLPALAATLGDPTAAFAGTATPLQPVAGQRGFFVVQAARFGHGPGSRGFLAVFVPAARLNLALADDPHHFAVSLEARRLAGTLATSPAATERFVALTRHWRVDVAREPRTALQGIVPWAAIAWPLATALLVYLVGRAILRRRRAEREVDDIFGLSLDLLGIVGLDGYFKRVNPAFERTLGYDTGKLLSRPLLDFVDPADREATAKSIGQLRDGREALSFESRFVRADGLVRWLQWYARLIPARGLMYAVGRDVTATRMLVNEQAALRRVATLVARGHAADELLEAVAVEVGGLLEADATRLLRYEEDGSAVVVAASGASDGELGARPHPGRDGRPVWSRLAQRSNGAAPAGRTGTARPPAELLPELDVEEAVAAPIVVSGRPWGVIVAAWRRADMAHSDANTRIAKFTELVATAVANAQSRAELAESRRRVVATADETRRRIERDLHDGAQQRQVQTIFALRLVQQALGESPDEAAELVGQALDNAENANAELRELARGIHPAVLTEGGLAPALQTIARRSPIPVTLDVRTEGRLPERVEVTAYYVVSEALTNAAKHAHAAEIRVTVDRRDDQVQLTISDDGMGGADPAAGSGLVGLRDRVEAAGGTLSVRSPPGAGTQLTVELPLAEP